MCDRLGLSSPSVGVELAASSTGPLSLEQTSDSEPTVSTAATAPTWFAWVHKAENFAISETSEMSEISEELEDTAVNMVLHGVAVTSSPLRPARDDVWSVLQRGMERQMHWMRLITQVLHSLAATIGADLTVQLRHSRFALDGYVELVFHRHFSDEDGHARVLESLLRGMKLTGRPA